MNISSQALEMSPVRHLALEPKYPTISQRCIAVWENQYPSTHATFSARGVVHVYPIWAFMSKEVLAAVLIETAAATHC